MILGFLGVALALLLLPYVPDRMAKKDMAFLDVVSIHQTDEELMERGIYGLGGFLSVSKELRVLCRLWCVFELAAYRSANPNGVISFSPLFVEQAVFILAITGYISTGVFWVSLGNKEQIGGGILWVYVLAFGPLYVAMHFLRKNIMAKHQLLWQLESFDVDQAQCRTAFDKEFIYRAIAAWYGSPQRFNEYVRGPLRQELLGKSATGFPWYYGLFVTSASMSISIDVMLGHYLGGAPPERVGAHFFSDTLGMNCFWTLFTLKIILLMCDRLAMACCKSVLLDYLQSLLVCAVHTGIYFLGLVLGKRAYEGGIHWSLAWCGFAFTLVFLSYSSVCRLAVKSCCRLRGEGAKGLAPEPSCADTAEKAVFEAPASKQVEC
ncbi:unnamed protein product [Effrenium voratum]|nr:unnamed protein product [Effrenium voratum]